MHLLYQDSEESIDLAPPRTQGADVIRAGVRYRTWTDKQAVKVAIHDAPGAILRTIELHPEGDGYFCGIDDLGRVGDLYRYSFGGEASFPDPASRWQPFGVHGPSMVIDPGEFEWTDAGFSPPDLGNLVIYELHIGTFTTEGSFLAAISRLGHIAALGATAVEIMPVADFPGERNWGYDGVALYAPSRAYGHPDDLRALVDAAHAHGLAVILDVVYNHLGPDGNYLSAFHRHYYSSRHKTPWGDGLNFEKAEVRQFFVENAPYWRNEFHFDGFRLDATHAIADNSPVHVLAETTDAIHGCGAFVIAEDERKFPNILNLTSVGGLGFDGCWADDFHHIVHVMLTGEKEGYYSHYDGNTGELARAITSGWLVPANNPPTWVETPEPSQFVFTISNHDQIGNRAFGERLGTLTDAAAYRAASALLCLAPQTPLLFMGQEWNCSNPFQFFTDHPPQLGRDVTKGRRYEFRHFRAFADAAMRDKIPDPQEEGTFLASKLSWSELEELKHASIFLLYQESLKLRRAYVCPNSSRFETRVLDDGAIAVLFGEEPFEFAVVASLRESANGPLASLPNVIAESECHEWRRVLSSNEARFRGLNESSSGSSRTEAFARNLA
jgi:maltooligosyltrehalose trehalohydrolase